MKFINDVLRNKKQGNKQISKINHTQQNNRAKLTKIRTQFEVKLT